MKYINEKEAMELWNGATTGHTNLWEKSPAEILNVIDLIPEEKRLADGHTLLCFAVCNLNKIGKGNSMVLNHIKEQCNVNLNQEIEMDDATVNLGTKYALSFACKAGNIKNVNWLLENGANPETVTKAERAELSKQDPGSAGHNILDSLTMAHAASQYAQYKKQGKSSSSHDKGDRDDGLREHKTPTLTPPSSPKGKSTFVRE